jgi:hypothetical protein
MQMEPETANIVIQPQIDRSRWVTQAELKRRSTCRATSGRWEWNAEETEGLPVTELSTGELFAERPGFDFELGMIGRHERGNREDELGI